MPREERPNQEVNPSYDRAVKVTNLMFFSIGAVMTLIESPDVNAAGAVVASAAAYKLVNNEDFYKSKTGFAVVGFSSLVVTGVRLALT